MKIILPWESSLKMTVESLDSKQMLHNPKTEWSFAYISEALLS